MQFQPLTRLFKMRKARLLLFKFFVVHSIDPLRIDIRGADGVHHFMIDDVLDNKLRDLRIIEKPVHTDELWPVEILAQSAFSAAFGVVLSIPGDG